MRLPLGNMEKCAIYEYGIIADAISLWFFPYTLKSRLHTLLYGKTLTSNKMSYDHLDGFVLKFESILNSCNIIN